MRVLELKAILARSNPTVIRQFTIPVQATAEQLKDVVQILIGWEPYDGTVCGGGVSLPPEKPVGEAFAENRDLICRLEETMELRLICLGEREQAEEYPVPIRWRGFDVPQEISSLRSFNKLQAWWTRREYGYYGRYGLEYYHYDQRDYMFADRAVTRKLRLYFQERGRETSGRVTAALQYEYAEELGEILEERTVAELKEIAKAEGIFLAAGLKKGQILACVADELFRPEIFEDMIRCMTIPEYEIFKKAASGKRGWTDSVFCSRVFARFAVRGFADVYEYEYADGLDVTLAAELLDLYGDWLGEGKEESFLRMAKVYTIIQGCVLLYGYIQKDEWLRLASFWTGKDYTERELEEAWDMYFDFCLSKRNPLLDCENPDVLYNRKEFDGEVVAAVLRERKRSVYYQPSFEKLTKIETEGLGFEERECQTLRAFLKNRCNVYEADMDRALKWIYHVLRCNTNKNLFIAGFQKFVYFRDNKVWDRLWELMEELRPCIRRICYGGYTEKEYGKLMKGNLS